MIGKVVCSKRGRDKGSFMVVVGEERGMLLVCNGKERPLERPKAKNLKHLSLTNSSLDNEQFSSNRALRKALKAFGETVSEMEE